MSPTEFIRSAADNQERKVIEQLDIQVGYAEKPVDRTDKLLHDEENGRFGVFKEVEVNSNATRSAELIRHTFVSELEKASPMMRPAANEASAVTTTMNIFEDVQATFGTGERAAIKASTAVLTTINDKAYLAIGCVDNSPVMLWRGGKLSNLLTQENQFMLFKPRKGDKVVITNYDITGSEARLEQTDIKDALNRENSTDAARRLIEVSKNRDDKSVIVLAFGKSAEKLPKGNAPTHTSEEEVARTPEKPSLNEKIRAGKVKAAAFIAGLGLGQKLNGINISGVSERAREAVMKSGSRMNNSARNAAAWTVVKGDALTATVKSKETYANFQDRLAKRFNQAQDSLVKLHASASHGISRQVEKHREKAANRSEEEQKRRQKIIGRALGVAIVGLAAGVATYKIMQLGGTSGGGNINFFDALLQDQPDSKGDNPKQQGSGNHQNDHGQNHHTPDHNPNNPEAQSVPRQLSLDEKGSSIWSTIDSTAQERGVKLTDAQTYELVEKTLQHNNLTWEEAQHLPVDYNFGVPEEVRRQLEETED